MTANSLPKYLLAIFLAAASVAALAADASSAPPPTTHSPDDPLVKILVSKGVITESEAGSIESTNPDEQRDRLILLLQKKGVLSVNDTAALGVRPVTQPTVQKIAAPAVVTRAEISKPPEPQVVPAITPLRVLQLEPAMKNGLIPDLKLGSGARIKIYGMIKASTVFDSSSPSGTDMPLPGFIPVNSMAAPANTFDSGPGAGNEFHVKARALRVGSNFEWPDISDKLTLTGKIEFDFEGNFTRVLNRNISTIRSSQASIRLAWARMDYRATKKTSVYALFGQDWTPFGSSTLPNLVETTGLGLGFGTLYERAAQMRVGLTHMIGGTRKVSITPELALVMPAYGNDPKAIDDQLGYGERQGADSGRPELQGRLVTQFQLDQAAGVAPAQVIVSFVQGARKALVKKGDIPLCMSAECPNADFFRMAFPNGAEVGNNRWGVTGELQLPTRYVTVLTKYWRGTDLRWYFVGSLLSNFNDLGGLTSLSSTTSIDGSSTVFFGVDANGKAVVAPQRGVRAQGGFVNLGFPLGRIFHADPAGRNAGWQFYLHYAYDEANASDARRTAATAITPIGNVRNKNDLGVATLMWKVSPYITFGLEQSLYRTRMAGGTTTWGSTAGWPTWEGKPAREWHDLRSEFSTTFTF